MPLRAALLATAAALSLSACAFPGFGGGGQPPPPADLQVPPTWSLPATAGEPAPITDPWWAAFGSRELTGFVERARRDNPDLLASAYRIAQARARVRQAGAGLYPSLDASGSGTRNWRLERPAANSFQVGLDASYELDVWGGTRAGIGGAEAREAAARFDREAMALSLSADVAIAYLQYLNLNDRLAIARRILDITQQVLDLVETRERLGAASGLEVAQQRGAVASVLAAIPELEQQRRETLNALAELLGTVPGAVEVQAESLGDIDLPVIAPGLPSALLLRRPDLRSAEAAVAASRADVAAARAAMLPSIRLTGGAGFSSGELAALFTPAGFLANLAFGLATPLIDGGRLAAQQDEAVAAQYEAYEAYRAAVLASFHDVEDALAAIRYLAEVAEARQAAVAEATRAYELAETRYRAGVEDFLTLLEAQRTLFQEETSLQQTRLARLVATVGLYRTLGGGWEDGGIAEAGGSGTS